MKAIKLTVLENGNLKISIADREDFETVFERKYADERASLADLMDTSLYIGNDWHCPDNIELTETPIIGNVEIYPNDKTDGETIGYNRLWYYPHYMMKSFMDVLSEEGQVIFQCY